MKKQSEFGSGFLICLVKFAEHFMNDIYFSEDNERRQALLKMWGTEEALSSWKIKLWANEASDHLYEIVAPRGRKWNSIRKKVETLKGLGLTMGHGFTGKTWTLEDEQKLMTLTQEIALETDKLLGVEGDLGRW